MLIARYVAAHEPSPSDVEWHLSNGATTCAIGRRPGLLDRRAVAGVLS